MDFEIIEKQDDVSYDIPAVRFPAYEEYKEKAGLVAEYINSMEVSEDTIKETKTVLAKARKLTDRLNRARIDMKKDLLKNYTVFESQVKEIVGIVDDADRELRGKVRELENIERENKKQIIKEIWDKRVQTLPDLTTYFPDAFERWLSPAHLNKSVSLKYIEKDMTEWLKDVSTELDTARKLGDEYLTEYIRLGDLNRAIETVKARAEVSTLIQKEDTDKTPKAIFIITGTKDINLTERLLKENEISYRKEI